MNRSETAIDAAFTEKLSEYAKGIGADLIGVAGIERFDGLPAEHHPASIFPEARSVVVVGKRIVRGALRGVEEGTQFGNYRLYGYSWLENRFLAMSTFKTCEFLEEHGWEAVPLLDLPVQMPAMGVPVSPEKPAPNVLVDITEAAVRAGLGEIGYLGLFVSPEFGTLQRMQAILTDAPLAQTQMLIDAVCDHPSDLASYCPLDAIDTSTEQSIEIAGKVMKTATINSRRCRQCQNGAMKNRYHDSGLPDRIAAVCGRSYLDHLQKSGRLGREFRNEFRKRDPWTVTVNYAMFDEEQDIE